MTSLDPGEIRFVDNVLPPAPADDYEVQVVQTVTLPASFTQPDPYTHTQRIQVTGPHFGLDPSSLNSFYPPAGGVSDYSLVLPHVVLNDRGLPWEIASDPTTSGATTAPWLALLVLITDEIRPPDDPKSPTLTQTVPLAEYLTPPTGTVGPRIARAQKDEWKLEYPKLSVVVVDVLAENFPLVAPTAAELPYLAHAREVDTGGQEILGIKGDGWFSVVVSNRLAQAPDDKGSAVFVAHLVSLEGFVSYLAGRHGPPAGTKAIRLASLASWSFTSVSEDADFAALMRGLDIDMLQLPAALVPKGSTAPEQTVQEALAGGYTATAYETRLGDETTAWYRGPCLPVQIERNLQPAYTASEAALVYDETTGMFDVSYAVAWQTGRLQALANRQFVIALIAWLRKGNSLALMLQQRLALFEQYDPTHDDGAAADTDDLLAPHAVRSLAFRYLATALGRERRLGEPRDPSGIRGHEARLPGVLRPEDRHAAIASGADPNHAVVARAREQAP